LHADRIDQYYLLYQVLEKYQQLLVEKFKDKNIPINIGIPSEQIETTVKTSSNFVTSCIMLSSLSKQTSKIAQGNMILQAVMAAYAMCNSFFQIITYKKEQKKLVEAMTYQQMVIKFPQIVLIEYQLKIIKLLLEMHSSSNLAERAFARIHLVSLILPRPYEGMSKKLAKKTFKKYFNQEGDLVSLEECVEEKIYLKFLNNISINWQTLVLNAQKLSTDVSLFTPSQYMYVQESSWNQKIMQMIEASRNKDIEKLYELQPNILEATLQELYDFLLNEMDSQH
jgi:hypothetical protein